jgi:Pyruvate/2-oxoacid:ferredoxin oxidoreductase delta subunit
MGGPPARKGEAIMSEQVYKDLCQTMIKRGGLYPGMDLPEFYPLVEELFTPEQAALTNALPKGFFTAAQAAEASGRDSAQTEALLETMADKGLVTSAPVGDQRFYGGIPFVPGIFEFQFMGGGTTDRDRKIARLIHDYKHAVDATRADKPMVFPTSRVITVDRMVQAGNVVHTYDQVASYIEKYDPISVATCFCRHEAELLDPKDVCDKPNDVCMMFGLGATFVIERGIGRKVDKAEARQILQRAEDAGLVHCSNNTQEIDFLCNCCSCHCMILKKILQQPKPAMMLFSSFQPTFDFEACTGCETCVERCPGTALKLDAENHPAIDRDRCFGCGVCATGCPADAITMTAHPSAPAPPADRQALIAALKASRT